MTLTKDNTTALIIDVQEKIVPAMSDVAQFLKRTKFLLSGLAVFKIPVVSTRQYPKGLGDTLKEITEIMQNEIVFDKTTFSCLATKEIRDYFNAERRPNVILAGIEAHICILQSALDLLELGKRVYLVADCVSSRNPVDMQFAFERAFRAGVIPSTAEALLFELTQDSRSLEFKSINRLATGRM
ncbi:MAG: isochorismatase family protein [Thermoguttaceae bacterium]